MLLFSFRFRFGDCFPSHHMKAIVTIVGLTSLLPVTMHVHAEYTVTVIILLCSIASLVNQKSFAPAVES